MITVREVPDIQGWRALKPVWDDLLARSNADCLFLTWDWMDTWMNVYGNGGQWLVLVAEDAECGIVGIAPMMTDTCGKGMIKRLVLVGQKADTASEYLDWIIASGREDEIVRALCQHLFTIAAKRWDILEFGLMHAASSSLPVLRSMFGSAWREHPAAPSPHMILPRTWEQFLNERSSNVRTRLARLQRRHKTEVLLAPRDISIDDAMQVIARLNRTRWAERGSSFRSDRYKAFHHEIATRFANQDRLMIVLMRCDGEFVAGRYDFAYGGRGYCFQGGWLPEWEKLSIGKMVMAETVRHCIERGLHEYDFLGGAANYKDAWASGERGLLHAQAWRPGSLKGALWQGLRSARSLLNKR